MSYLLMILLLVPILLGMVILVLSVVIKDASSLKIMLLGIAFILLGGILAVDPDSSLGGIEYIIVFFGFLVSILGFSKKD